MSAFWQGWLTLWCYGIMLVGLLLSGAGIEGLEAPAVLFFELLNPTQPFGFSPVERFAVGLMGAVTLGWGLTMFYFVRAARIYGGSMWRQLVFVALVWYLVDGYISYATGFPLNVVSNTVLIGGLLLPLYASGKLRRG